MARETIAFDIASELNTQAAKQEYLKQVFADGDVDEVLRALGHVARAHGLPRLATSCGMRPSEISNALKSGARPRFETIWRICHALGWNLVPRVRAPDQKTAEAKS